MHLSEKHYKFLEEAEFDIEYYKYNILTDVFPIMLSWAGKLEGIQKQRDKEGIIIEGFIDALVESFPSIAPSIKSFVKSENREENTDTCFLLYQLVKRKVFEKDTKIMFNLFKQEQLVFKKMLINFAKKKIQAKLFIKNKNLK